MPKRTQSKPRKRTKPSPAPKQPPHSDQFAHRLNSHNITQKQKGETALRESEERYRLLVEFSPEAIAVHSEGKIVFANTAAATLMGARDAAELLGKPVLSVVHPDFHDIVTKRLARMSKEGKAAPVIEEKFVRLDSAVIDVEVASIPITYNGKPAVQTVIRNISDRKKTEIALRDALHFNEQIVSTAGQGIVVYDSEFRHVVWNTFMEQLTGITAQEALGQKAVDVFPHFKEQGLYELLLRSIAGETTKSDDTYLYLPKTGKSAWVMSNYVPHRNAQGKVIGVIGVISDISEQKRIEEAVRQSDERYRAFISQSTEGIYRFEFRKPMPVSLTEDEQIEYIYKNGFHSECNIAMAEMYGFSSPQELIGRPTNDLLPRSDPHNIEYLRAFIRSQYRLADAESHEVDKNGNAKFFLNNIIGTVENGLLMHVWGTQRDISERKLAEEAFRQSESKYRHLIEQMNDGLMQVTPDNVILFVNKQLCDLVGYTQEELLGKVATDILTDKAGKKTVFSKLELRKKGISDQYEIQLIKKSGERIWVRISGSPVYDRHGNVVGSIGLHTDITEQKRSEEALRASEEKFRGLFENVPDGVYQSTPEGRLLAANPALVRLLGYDTEEELCAVDSTAQFYVDPSQRQAFLLVLNTQGELRNAELVLRRKNGDIITVLENSRCIRNDEGEILYYEGTLTDITEQQSAREALKESERKYRILTEQSNDAIYLLYDGKFEVVNHKFEELFGISADEARAPGFNFLDLVAPESIPLIEERQRMVKRGEEPPLRYEFNARSRSGKLIPLEASVSYITYKGGTAVQGILRDVTERKNAEEGLKQMLSLLQSTLESTADGILLVDQSGKIVTFNRRFSQLWRIPQEVIDRGDETALVSALDQLKNPDAFVSKKIELDQKPETESFDTIEFKDGRVFERYSIPQRAEGKVVGRVWSFRDITTRLQAEKALRESEEKYRTLFEESKDVVFISSVDGQFVDINPAGVALFGFSTKEELMRVNIANELYFNQNDRKAFHRVIERYGFVRDFELILRRKDGEKLIVLETATAVRDDNGIITAYRGIIRDITERKRLEEQLRQAQKLQSIGTLAGGIAHDFNNILSIVLGYISRLSRDKTNIERIDQSISAITKATERGTGLVRQLLTFARQTDVTLESVNVNEVVDEIARIVQETFPKTITLSLELAQTLPSIVADSNQLHQALLNLCLNAKDAMPEGGRLTITTEVMNGERVRHRLPKALDESYVCVSISDSGTGMDEATLNRIFEPFFTTKRRGAGTGLGLAVVYGIIDSLRGFIDVYSELGRGTTFRLYFLNPQGEVVHTNNATILRADIPGGTETILVVEDEDMLLELLKSTLEAKGYRVLTARDGVEAVDVYREQYRGIAAVITDLGLPKLGGLESSMEMMSINPKLKVVFASGYLDPNIKTELRKAPASDFIQKPYDTDEVLLRVRSLIDSPKT